MNIQKGIVKYKDRNDIVCTYGITDEGVQYYFLDNTDTKQFSNGNRIVSTALVEAVDPMVKASQVGVIDPDGNIVIPCENKSIKPVDDKIILVEKSAPTSESVIEAVNLRNDPLSATKLVSTPAIIKERLNTQMGGEGRYLFNDQFSEASLFDINGNNLVNDEYYSFIAMANNKLYFSKNTTDSIITEYSLIPVDTVQTQNVASGEDVLRVEDVVISPDVVENALEGDEVQEIPSESLGTDTEVDEQTDEVSSEDVQEMPTDLYADTAEDVNDQVEQTEDETIESDQIEEKINPDVVNEDSDNVRDSEEVIDTNSDEKQGLADTIVEDVVSIPPIVGENSEDNSGENETTEEAQESVLEAIDEAIAREGQGQPDEEVASEDGSLATVPSEDSEKDEEIKLSEDIENDSDEKHQIEDTSEFNENDIESRINASAEDDTFIDSVAQTDSIIDIDDYLKDSFNKPDDSITSSSSIIDIGNYFDKYVTDSNIMNDVATSMSELIKQNASQKRQISEYREKLVSFDRQMKSFAEDYNTQTEKLKTVDEAASRLYAENQSLHNRTRELEREIKALKEQLKGTDDLVKLVKDAKVLLSGESDNYEGEASYYRRAA